MRIAILSIALLIGSLLQAQSTAVEEYGKNRIAISPFMAYGSSSFNDVAVGLGYEHFFNSKVAFQSDFAVGLENEMFQVMVGPKFYPRDHDKPVSYALAPVFFFLQGKDVSRGFYYYENIDFLYPKLFTYQQVGFMLINSVNMTLSEQVYFGVEAGLGINYLNRYKAESADDYGDNEPGANGLFRINIGYRF